MVLGATAAICLLFGAVYPLVMIIIYPIYRLVTGDKDFRSYLRDL